MKNKFFSCRFSREFCGKKKYRAKKLVEQRMTIIKVIMQMKALPFLFRDDNDDERTRVSLLIYSTTQNVIQIFNDLNKL